MEAGGGVGGAADAKKCVVVALAAGEEGVRGQGGAGESTVSAAAVGTTVVDAAVISAAVIGSAVVPAADLAAVDSAAMEERVGVEGDAGESTVGGVVVGAAVIGATDLAEGPSAMPDLDVKQATGEPSEVKPDMQPVVDETEEGGEPSRKRKLSELAPYGSDESSDGSLEYDSEDSAESVDSRNVRSFTRKLLQKLEDGTLPYVKRGRYFCPWYLAKPKRGELVNLIQHAHELSKTGIS